MNQLYKTLKISSSFHKSLLCHNGVKNAVNVAFQQTQITPFRLCSGQRHTSAAASVGAINVGKKQKELLKVTLVAQNDSITVTSLDEAQKLAKRRDLHLIKLQDLDTKTQRPVYKLVTAADLLSQELQDVKPSTTDSTKSTHKKSDKLLTIGSRISDHDLASRLKNISKWLSKCHEVRILIQCNADDLSKGEKIAKTIEKSVMEPEAIGKVVQQRTRDSVIKFSIIPIKPQVTQA